MKKVSPDFGECLQELREQARSVVCSPGEAFGWKIVTGEIGQREFSRLSGVPLGTIREVEQGNREPGIGTMQRWIAALKRLGVEITLDALPDIYEPPPIQVSAQPPEKEEVKEEPETEKAEATSDPTVQSDVEPLDPAIREEAEALARTAKEKLAAGDRKGAIDAARAYLALTGKPVPKG